MEMSWILTLQIKSDFILKMKVVLSTVVAWKWGTGPEQKEEAQGATLMGPLPTLRV